MKQSLRRQMRDCRGQVADLGVDTIAIMLMFIINLIMFGVFAMSETGKVITHPIGASVQATELVSSALPDPYTAAALSAYLRTPMQSSKGGLGPETTNFLEDNPEIWKGKTYGEFLSMLIILNQNNPQQLKQVFIEATNATFSGIEPKNKMIVLDYDQSKYVNEKVGFGFLEQADIESIRTADQNRFVGAPIAAGPFLKARIWMYQPASVPEGS